MSRSAATPSLPGAQPAPLNARPLAGVLMGLAAAMLWGTTGTAQSLAPAGLSAYWVVALRLVVSALFFAACVGLQREPLAVQRAGLHWPSVLLAGACMTVYNLAFFAGVRAAGVAVGTAVAIGSGPIWAGLLDTLVNRRAPGLAWWCGTLLAVAGGCLLVGLVGAPGGRGLAVSPLGIVLCLAAGFSYAAYVLANKRLVASVSPAMATLSAFGCAAVMATPLAALIAGPLDLSGLPPASLGVLVYLGVVATGVAYLLFSSAQRHIAASTAVTLALGEPLTAFLLALWVVGEQPAPGAFAGMALVMAGLGVVVWTELRAARRGG
jgi:DME family drug/metabolite transporter